MPKRPRRGKAALRERLWLEREFLLRLEKILEAGHGGKELLPAAQFLARVTIRPLSELALDRAAEGKIGQDAALQILRDIEAELIGMPTGAKGAEVRRIRAKLERKIRGIRYLKRPFLRQVDKEVP